MTEAKTARERAESCIMYEYDRVHARTFLDTAATVDAITAAIEDAVKQEREACIKACGACHGTGEIYLAEYPDHDVCSACAPIRSRAKTPGGG